LDKRRRIAYRIVIGLLAEQGALGFVHPHWRRRHSEKRDARFGHLSGVIEVHDGDDARNSKVTVAPRDLFQRVTARRPENRKYDLPKNFIRLQSGRQIIDKKFVSRNDPIHAPPRDLELCIEGRGHRRKLGRGIGMNKAST
jgi:hypothetical protein